MKKKPIDPLKHPAIVGQEPVPADGDNTKTVKYLTASVRPRRSLSPIKNWRSTSLFETKILPQHPALNKTK
jgi:hypothetical protein